MTATIVVNDNDVFAWLPEEDRELVHAALTAICEDMQDEPEEAIALACTQYLRDLLNSRTLH
jgi:hypothetical protein